MTTLHVAPPLALPPVCPCCHGAPAPGWERAAEKHRRLAARHTEFSKGHVVVQTVHRISLQLPYCEDCGKHVAFALDPLGHYTLWVVAGLLAGFVVTLAILFALPSHLGPSADRFAVGGVLTAGLVVAALVFRTLHRRARDVRVLRPGHTALGHGLSVAIRRPGLVALTIENAEYAQMIARLNPTAVDVTHNR